MVDGPIQLVLNPERFRDQRPPGGGGGGKDFFEGQDAEFVQHRDRLAAELRAVVRNRGPLEVVNVLVTMRPDALAKSHRPFGSLFTRSRASHVGTDGFGELIFRATVANFVGILRKIESAEETVARVRDAAGQLRIVPTPARCETGAIATIEVWSAADRRGFTVAEAQAWIGSGAPSKIDVDLLGLPPRGRGREEAVREIRRVIAKMQDRPEFATSTRAIANYGIAQGATGDDADVVGPLDVVLASVEASPAVKRARLQEQVETPDHPELEVLDEPADIPADEPRGRPIVGVIDGGVEGPISSFVRGRSHIIAPEHRTIQTSDHATAIAGLISMGGALNTYLDRAEDCDVYDIGLFPDRRYLALYYSDLDSLMDQIRIDVQEAKRTHSVRIFNLSWNLRQAPGAPAYGLAAEWLDDIALELDVIFVVSAGNLSVAESRAEWPPTDTEALSILASPAVDELMMSPAESIANVTVGAVNPPNLALEIEGAPARYTRRGRRGYSSVKPDLASYGGAAPDSLRSDSGLDTVNSAGNRVSVRGTSYAAPLVARYLASLDAAIAGYASRELLVALAAHYAEVPAILRRRAFADVAQSFVGHGVPASVESTLIGDEHSMTIVLADRLLAGKRVELPFTWPDSLTDESGKCRGGVQLTLVARPVVRYAHGEELVRVNLDASLKQADEEGRFQRRTSATHEFFSGNRYATERSLATELGKWFPIKSYSTSMPRGRGESPDWMLEIGYLTRAGEEFPEDGIEFGVVLTISDLDRSAPVFDDMRVSLGRTGVQISDLRTAVRVQT